MTQYSSQTQTALLRWVNTFDTRRKAATLQDLQDGVVLGQILEQMLAPEFNSSSLAQHPSTLEENKQNLETVYRGLASFLRDDIPALAPSPSKFRAITENPDDNKMCEFLTSFLIAACLGSLSKTYVPKIMELDIAAQGEIAKIIGHMNQLRMETESNRTPSQEDPIDLHTFRDPDLMEEELDQTKKNLDMVKKQNADLQSRIDKLLDSREALLQDLRNAQDELSAHKRTRGADATTAIRDLRNEIREKIVEIDRLEDMVQKETVRSARLEKENEGLRLKAERTKDLEDKITMLDHDTKLQQQHIKGLENYRKKAQDLTAIQQRNRILDEQIIQLEQDLRDFEDVKALNRKLQKEIEEKSRVLATNEQEIIFTIQSKNVLQDANEELKRRVDFLESRRQLDESRIRDLQEQLQLGDVALPGSESPDASTSKFNLEQELESTADPAIALRLELSRLKAENSLLRNNMTVASENERLRTELDSSNEKVIHYRLKCTEAMEKHAVIQEQINALVNSMTAEGDSVFINMRKDFLETTREVEKLRKQVQDLEADAADRERELIHIKTDLNAIGDEQSSALAALKSSDELISDSLKTELDATRARLSNKTFELDQMKEQLMGALISKDMIRKKLDEALAAAVPNGPLTPDDAPKGKKEDAEKIEKLRAALKQKQLEKAEQDKYSLQRRLKVAESGGANAEQKAKNEQTIKTLLRENAMISTAWYDLTGRLQTNNVVLQRRHDAPKSWLNKQRQLVNATPRR
ncbi:hypothetical protein B0T26DRAFT_784484 [Lasiosphaeria miniovina]|uniref:HOOK N-terminal domain-containing protein n=1 Tax=Lasiosphaeria miniovina TaxID=1954250 RepID=A0AA40DPZ2_9PEZI|nr:uncharacterized protein B0T26DRAFT_784484 [Lasiosphaeria miniovina]KAK0708967.1 hypothetical protein B0T26DRAFT_784484 [Lasiosphaeria miniovina]